MRKSCAVQKVEKEMACQRGADMVDITKGMLLTLKADSPVIKQFRTFLSPSLLGGEENQMSAYVILRRGLGESI